MKKILSSLAVIASCSFLSACGASDDAPEGWQTIHPKNIECTIQLPEPVANPARQDRQLYESTFNNGKSKIQVAVFGKLTSQTPNATDADIMSEQQKALIQQIQQNLVSSGVPAELQLDGDLPVEEGLGQQVRILCGPAGFVVTQAYITPHGFYFVKIDNADEKDPTVAQFMKSFKP